MNTENVCPACNDAPAEILCFTTVRGKDRTRFSGRVLFKGSEICDGCADCFETPTDGG